MFAGKKSAQIREILISESAWEEMTCLFAPSLDNYYVPVIAGGSFYKFVELDGLSYSVPMPFAEAVENSIKPSSNINGIESHDNASYPSGLLNYINIYTDESSMHRPTGLSFKCNGSSTKYSMGIISDNDESVHLGQHIFTLNNGEYINDVSVYSSQFVSKIEFKTNRRAFIVGQNPDYDNVQSVSLVNPFTVNSMYVPSDIAGYVNSSGHQMCGIVVSAIYNNEIARQYVSSLYK
ncbi:hypothetical protein J8O30_003425 [Salmonella enterica]|nr:hypothetical protein [Salmonella enterica]EHH6165081.1 hypothetical protein [Salmonella enterica]EHP0290034.1 hypothetical protein [Salmonella enterica]EHZ6479254.1 hypothetical protein [Salmonella enterica]EIP8641688.1 hypothetical protein [Salmonella enterica]